MTSHRETEDEDGADEGDLVADGGGVEKRIPNRGRVGRWPANDYY